MTLGDDSSAIERELANKYRIVRRLGRGGMGTVYEAEHIAIRRRCAIKVLREDLAGDKMLATRFRREATLASRLRSPYVVTVFDFGVTSSGTPYMAMELLDGAPLSRSIKGGVPWREATRIAETIARALAAAHEAGIVHRDLKPDNVMRLPDGSVKVLDFGIAKLLDADAGETSVHLTQAGAIVGTPTYMSPEAAGRKPVGVPGDLYALGVMLFEMLVGRPPFVEKETVLLMGMHLRVAPERVREARPSLDVPDALEGLVDRLLAKRPEARPSSAADVVEELAQLQRDPTRAAIYAPPEPKAPTPPIDPVIASVETVIRADANAIAPTVPLLHLAPTVVPSGPTPLTASGRAPSPRPAWPLALGAIVIAAVGIAALSTTPSEPTSVTAPPASTVVVAPVAVPTIASAPPPPASEVVAAPTPIAPPASIAIEIVATPRSATVRWDGHDVDGSTIEVVPDDRMHTIVVAAHGYQSESLTVPAVADMHLDVALHRRRAPRPQRRDDIPEWQPSGGR